MVQPLELGWAASPGARTAYRMARDHPRQAPDETYAELRGFFA